MGQCCGSSKNPYDIEFEKNISTEKLGNYRTPVPDNIRKSVKRALYMTEQAHGGPVYMPDIYRQWIKITYWPVTPVNFLILALEDLYYNDEILTDSAFHKYSVDPGMQHHEDNETGFRLYSDFITYKYP